MAYPFFPTRTGVMLLHRPTVSGQGYRFELLAEPMDGPSQSMLDRVLHVRAAGRRSPEPVTVSDSDGTLRFTVYQMADDPQIAFPVAFSVEVLSAKDSGKYRYRFSSGAVKSALEGDPAAVDPSQVEAALRHLGSSLTNALLTYGRRLSEKKKKTHSNLPPVNGWTIEVDTTSDPWLVLKASEQGA